MSSHDEDVANVSTVVKDFYSRSQPFRIFHGSTNSTRPAHGDRVVDISALSNVLEVDSNKKRAIVEPNVPMDKLVQATLAHGMIPLVVMEFPGITVGGGYAGSAGESSSFKRGCFDETVKSVEIVLANGEVVTASESENPDLLRGAAGSCGTLGITTKLELELMPAKRFVKLVYHPYSTVREVIEAIRKATEDHDNDFIDGIVFSKTHGVMMTGKLVDEIPEPEKAQTFSGSWDPWFYMHAKEKSTAELSTDYIPIAEYLFRYDRGGFWVGNYGFAYFGFVPFNRFTRWFLNDFMHTRMMYRALHARDMSFGYMIQDLSLPYESMEAFIDYTAEKLGIWPLWLCPLRATQPPTFHPCTKKNGVPQPMLNVGLWGKASSDMDTFVRQNRNLENRLTELGGQKVLYSHTYYSEEEFWRLYDEKWYRDMRKRYSATTLPTVYEKVRVDLVRQKQRLGLIGKMAWLRRFTTAWPLAGFIGIWYAIKSKDYLIHRRPCWTYWNLGTKKSS